MKSVFNPIDQEKNISYKIVAGLERISEVFKSQLWEYAKTIGLSPIQIQLLIFIAFHKQELCNVSHLAQEFNVTKPTVSDAVKVLSKKELIVKDFSSTDSRSYTILLSNSGKKIVRKTQNFAAPISKQLDQLENHQLENLYDSISQVISGLHKNGILSVQRTCRSCKHFESGGKTSHCNLINKNLEVSDIRIDCPDFDGLNNS